MPPVIVSAGVTVNVPAAPICNDLVAASSAIAVPAATVPLSNSDEDAAMTNIGPLLILFPIVSVPPVAVMVPAPAIVPPLIVPWPLTAPNSEAPAKVIPPVAARLPPLIVILVPPAAAPLLIVVRPVTVVTPPDSVRTWLVPVVPKVSDPALNTPPEIVSVPPVKLARPVTETVPFDWLKVPPVTADDAAAKVAAALLMSSFPELTFSAPDDVVLPPDTVSVAPATVSVPAVTVPPEIVWVVAVPP